MKKGSGTAFASSPGAGAWRVRQRKQPVQARARVTVEAILSATLQVLQAGGLAALTTTRVADRAGVSVGTLYQYFPDKRSLLAALEVRYLERVVDRIASAARAAVGLPLEPAVRAVVSALLSAKRENLDLTIALRQSTSDAGAATLLREAGRRLVGVMTHLLEEAVPGGPDPVAAAVILVGAVEGVIGAALQEAPQQLHLAAFEHELVALCVGYVRERSRAAR